MFAPGDLVVGVSKEFCNCPCGEQHTIDGWEDDTSVIGKYFTIESVYSEPYCPCILEFVEDEENCWCSGCFRKVEKASSKFIEQIQNIKPKVDA